jgi:diguanylate cyclase (GGDEF)-like protein
LASTKAAGSASTKVAKTDHTSLDQRFGALQAMRVGIVALMVATTASAVRQVGMPLSEVLEISAVYLAVCLTGQLLDGLSARLATAKGRRPRVLFQQVLIPVDSLYLALLTVPSGGAQSDFVWLFTVQLIAVTLLAGRRTGVRVALWDSALLLAITFLKLGDPVAQLLGVAQHYAPSAGEVAVRISGFWAVALCTAFFSSVSERELRRQRAQLDSLSAMAKSMEEAIEQAEATAGATAVAPVLAQKVMEVFGFQRTAVIWERKGEAFALRAASSGDGDFAAERAHASPGALGSELAQRALSSTEPPRARNLSKAGAPALEELLPGSANVVVVGMSAGQDGRGLLLAEAGPARRRFLAGRRGSPPERRANADAAANGRRVSRRSLQMLSRFAAHAALALANADLKAENARMADTDSLTGIANRRSFTHLLGREVARTQRSREPLSLAVIDIDYFKKINDSFGHLAGDQVLRDVARAMADHVRDVDIVARYGGEEFAIVLPNCSTEGAVTVVERVRSAIASASTLTKVTVSAGIATVAGEGGDGEALMAAADSALYASKRAGRDRVTVAPSGTIVVGETSDRVLSL